MLIYSDLPRVPNKFLSFLVKLHRRSTQSELLDLAFVQGAWACSPAYCAIFTFLFSLSVIKHSLASVGFIKLCKYGQLDSTQFTTSRVTCQALQSMRMLTLQVLENNYGVPTQMLLRKSKPDVTDIICAMQGHL